MPVRRTLAVDHGVAVVRHEADGGDVAPLQGRADALAAAGRIGPGVVDVVRTGSTSGGWELVTAYAGVPLSGARLAGAPALATVGAAVAGTLAGLHARGLVHGRLGARHVLVGRDGAPRLCGLAAADEATSATAADDVAALARALLAAVDGMAPAASRGERARRARLADVLAAASSDDAALRPTARRFAAELAALVAPHPGRPGGGSGAPAAPVGQPAPGTSSRLRAATWAAAAIAVVVVAGLAARGRGGPAAASSADRRGQPNPGAAEATTTSWRPPTTTTPPPPCVVGTRVQLPEAPGARCPHEVSVGGGAVVVDGRQVRVGRPGDEVLVAEWGCEGGVRPAVLRPATGEVLLYGPVGGDEPASVAQAERVAGATGLAAGVDGDACPILLVVTAEGAIRLT